ncbi:diguanylate cyclase [Hazenella sp. IB182357]|uniref:histidine kinase n=1 Tax=Polycladospora coralii TaxID=2771432 RepID=A0A926RTR2_9BACL|nr:ATP-binding protein [Polycladospora coralii]MBD1372013.1 diguanylate cyclase [Polycladospora coralii]MBS7530519.1 diguanylate cyclase [Polycladospora coralii]
MDDVDMISNSLVGEWIEHFSEQSEIMYGFVVGITILLLVTLVLLKQKHIEKLPPYAYVLGILICVAILDAMTKSVSPLSVFLILLGYMQFRSVEENSAIITILFTATYLLVDILTFPYDTMHILELVSHAALFLWISWLALQVKQAFFEKSRLKERQKYMTIRMNEAQNRILEYNEEIEETYRRDYLTALYNFGAFQEQVIYGLTRLSKDHSFHVICMDLTDFQQINIKEGIDVGDQVLVEIANRLKEALPSSAIIARYDGDQFAIGMIGNQLILRRLLESIEAVMKEIQTEHFLLNYCLGSASYPEEASCGAELIRLAEQRLTIQQRRIRNQEEEHKKHLEKLSAVGQLAAGLAHEIRNPLTSIRGFVQISAAESESVKKWESIILPEIDRINQLLKQFLNLSESRPAHYAYFNLEQVIYDVLSLMQPKATLMGHDLVPRSCAEQLDMEADAEQIKQILINLIQNALESFQEKGVVEVHWRQIDQEVRIEIRDNGTGIKPENLTKIFEPFFSTKGDGTGMGLSVCHRIVTEHKGQIHVSSQPGRGTIFHLTLPLNQRDVQREDSDSEQKMMDSLEFVQEVSSTFARNRRGEVI